MEFIQQANDFQHRLIGLQLFNFSTFQPFNLRLFNG
ncbi:hypothetical protein EVA_08656 [gut metagenome]|uniref:Uncharacterized protein n=1 Tax=gut metagenome TaxID=749906 RepID=J9GSL4_9ZZZZ